MVVAGDVQRVCVMGEREREKEREGEKERERERRVDTHTNKTAGIGQGATVNAAVSGVVNV